MSLFAVSEHMYRAVCTTFAICHLLDVLYIFNQIRSKVILVNARIYEPLIRIYGEAPWTPTHRSDQIPVPNRHTEPDHWIQTTVVHLFDGNLHPL